MPLPRAPGIGGERVREKYHGGCVEPGWLFALAFHRIIQDARRRVDPDITLIDIGPNLGAINRAALLSSDTVLMPLAADLFSLRGLRNLGIT